MKIYKMEKEIQAWFELKPIKFKSKYNKIIIRLISTILIESTKIDFGWDEYTLKQDKNS